MVREEEQILNAVKGEPCRNLGRDHSSRGNKREDRRGACLVCSQKCQKAASAGTAGERGARVVDESGQDSAVRSCGASAAMVRI